MGKIDNTDLNNLLNQAIEAKPEFVPPPPLIPYGNTELKSFIHGSIERLFTSLLGWWLEF